MGPDELTTNTVFSETEIGPVNFDTPIIHISNPPNWDADGDVQAAQFSNAMDTVTTYAAEGFLTNYFQDAVQAMTIRLGNLDTSDPETFYDFLKMWPLYNNNGQVIGLFDTKEHRDQAKERLEKMAAQRPTETTLQRVLKNVHCKTPADGVS